MQIECRFVFALFYEWSFTKCKYWATYILYVCVFQIQRVSTFAATSFASFKNFDGFWCDGHCRVSKLKSDAIKSGTASASYVCALPICHVQTLKPIIRCRKFKRATFSTQIHQRDEKCVASNKTRLQILLFEGGRGVPSRQQFGRKVITESAVCSCNLRRGGGGVEKNRL